MTDAPEYIWIRTWQDRTREATTNRQFNYPSLLGYTDSKPSLLGYTDSKYRRADLPPTLAEAMTVPEVAALLQRAERAEAELATAHELIALLEGEQERADAAEAAMAWLWDAVDGLR